MSDQKTMDPQLLEQFDKMSLEAYGERAMKSINSKIKTKKILTNFLELYLGPKITETFHIPKAIDFLRNHVSKNLPLVIRGALNDTTAVKKWSSNYMR
jgi:hypothetical protein